MGEKILAKLKEIWQKIVEWWNHFTSKQKTYIVIIAAVVVVAFVGLYAILSAPDYVSIKECENTNEASQVIDVLKEEGISYKTSDDGLQIRVRREDQANANIALGASGIVVDEYSIEDALSSSFTTTESDKNKKYQLYLETRLERHFVKAFDAVKSAQVNIYMPDNDGTLLHNDEKAGAAVVLGIDGDFDKDNAANLAKLIATILGCENTDDIVIMDMKANLLFAGSDDTSISGNASSQLGVKAEAENLMNNDVKRVLQGTGVLGDIKVSSNLDIDFTNSEHTRHEYTPADGQSQGLLSEEKNYTESSTGGNGGVPGTDSNGETTYQYADNTYSESTIEELYKKYLPNEDILFEQIPPGKILYNNSSVAVSSTSYVVVNEDDVKKQGILDGITWDEYKAANSERRQITINEDLIELVSNATGIPTDSINIVAYEENVFVDSEGLKVDIQDIIQIVLIVLILGLLAIVVFKSMRTEKAPEEAEELSVENLLQSNPEPQIDSIETEQISESRRMIEKFVDENPEAVANLLRNWLNESFG